MEVVEVRERLFRSAGSMLTCFVLGIRKAVCICGMVSLVALALAEPEQLAQACERTAAFLQEVARKDLLSGSTVLDSNSEALA